MRFFARFFVLVAAIIAAAILLSPFSLSGHVEEHGKYLHHVEDLFLEADGCRMPANPHRVYAAYAASNASAVYGILAAGFASSHGEIRALCNTPWETMDYPNVFLNPCIVRKQFCDVAVTSRLCPRCVRTFSPRHYTFLYAAQLTAFCDGGAECLRDLTARLDQTLLEAMGIKSGTLLQAITNSSALTSPQPNHPPLYRLPNAVSRDLMAIKSHLFAWQHLSAVSRPQITDICNNFGTIHYNIIPEMGLDPKAFLLTFCNPPNKREALHFRAFEEPIRSWNSRLFVVKLLNSGHGKEWWRFLCKNIEPYGLELVGLDGFGIRDEICGQRVRRGGRFGWRGDEKAPPS